MFVKSGNTTIGFKGPNDSFIVIYYDNRSFVFCVIEVISLVLWVWSNSCGRYCERNQSKIACEVKNICLKFHSNLTSTRPALTFVVIEVYK